MTKSTPETIVLKGEYNFDERDANAAISPGDLIQLMSTNKVRKHPTAAGFVGARWFAIENDIAGDDIDVNYAATEVVRFHKAKPGDQILAWLGEGNVAVIGSPLVSAGDGALSVSAVSSASLLEGAVVAIALEAVTTDSATTSRIKVEVV